MLLGEVYLGLLIFHSYERVQVNGRVFLSNRTLTIQVPRASLIWRGTRREYFFNILREFTEFENWLGFFLFDVRDFLYRGLGDHFLNFIRIECVEILCHLVFNFNLRQFF